MLGEPGVRGYPRVYKQIASKLQIQLQYQRQRSIVNDLYISRTNESKSGLKSNYTVSFEAGSVG